MNRYFVLVNCIVAYPGCLSRVLGPDFYPSRIPNLGSRNPDPTKAAKEKEEKISCLTFFVATFFTKLSYFIFQCGGSGMFIQDPTFFHPGSELSPSRIPDPGTRILIKEFKYFNPKKSKKWFLSSKNMIRVVHPGSRIRMLTFSHPGIPEPGSRGQKGIQSRIPDPDPQHCHF
jgi:hypothetical protein